MDALSSYLRQLMFEVQRFSMVQAHHVVSVLSLTWLADSAAKELLAFELQFKLTKKLSVEQQDVF